MTFEEFWEKEARIMKKQGYCTTLAGIRGYAKKAFETGQQNCDCVHTDNSAVIERLQNENKQLKKQYEFLSNQICHKECVEVWGEIDKLKEQIEKMKCCGNCKYCDGDNPCEWHRKNTQCEHYFHWEMKQNETF